MRDRLRQRDPHARHGRTRRVRRLHGDCGDRTPGVRDEPVDEAEGAHIGEVDVDSPRLRTLGDIGRRFTGFDDDRCASSVDAAVDCRQLSRRRSGARRRPCATHRRTGENGRQNEGQAESNHRGHRDSPSRCARCARWLLSSERHGLAPSVDRNCLRISRCLTRDNGSCISCTITRPSGVMDFTEPSTNLSP